MRFFLWGYGFLFKKQETHAMRLYLKVSWV